MPHEFHSPIAITGIGLVCPLGNSLPVALARAIRGERGIRAYASPWVEEQHGRLFARVGGTVEGFDADAWLEPKLAAKQEPAVLFALAAAHEALEQSGLLGAHSGDRVGCVIGGGLPGSELYHRALHSAYAEGRPQDIARMTAIAITGNAATSQIGLRWHLRGPALGLANACASGTAAIAIAMDQIRLGRADAMVVGGCESSMRGLLTYACFVEAGMHVTTEPARACTPFAGDRRGFVLAEGAAVLVLERLDHAQARGAQVFGLLAGSAITNDAYHVIHPEPSGAAWARTITLALADAGIHPEQVDAISAHATATAQGDLAETRAIKRVFERHAERIAISATKSMHGHAFGAAGAIELALAVAAMHAGVVLPTIDLDLPDPECDLDYVSEGARRKDVQVLVKNGFGAGGAATCLVVTRASQAREGAGAR